MSDKKDLTDRHGLFFEEFEIGQTVTTPARTITEADVVMFAGLTGDYNQLHTDEEFASIGVCKCDQHLCDVATDVLEGSGRKHSHRVALNGTLELPEVTLPEFETSAHPFV